MSTGTTAKTIAKPVDRRVSVAPMMGWTDRHDRFFLRLIAPNVLLYTVMLTTGAIIHGDCAFHLEYNEEEHPVALQLGGSDPGDLARCAKVGQEYGYDEINLNCGCPSGRVQRGRFGACLMREAVLVADCVDAMKQATDIPVTVKTRIGVDELDSYDFLTDFVGAVADKGCETFIIHARKAWLNGLSPKDNRTIPPLKWETVYRLKQDFPQLEIILNGGIKTLDHVREGLEHTDGVMIGREAYQNPWFLSEIEKDILGETALRSRHEVVEQIAAYAESEIEKGVKLKDITRHILGLFQGIPGARKWRRVLSEEASKPGTKVDLIRIAAQQIYL